MSITMSDNTITVREFSSDDVNYRHNDDLPMELKKGGNESGDYEAAVLIKINVDGMTYSNVEVYGSRQSVADILDRSIAAQIKVRDALRSMTVAA